MIGGIAKEIKKKLRVPYPPVIFLIGSFIGLYKNNFGIFSHVVDNMININQNLFVLIVLPILVFEGSFNSDVYIYRR